MRANTKSFSSPEREECPTGAPHSSSLTPYATTTTLTTTPKECDARDVMRVFHASGMKEMEKEKKKWKRFYLVNSYNYVLVRRTVSI